MVTGAALTVCLVTGVGYLWSAPTTLRVAIGPEDRDHARLMAAVAQKLTQDRASVRLKLLRKGGLAENAAMVDDGEADLAVVRSDHMPKDGQTVALLQRDPVLFVALPGARVTQVADLRGRRIGMLAINDDNQRLLQNVLRQEQLELGQVNLISLTVGDIPRALTERRVDAVMTMSPLQGSLLDGIQSAFTDMGLKTPLVFGVKDAEAVAHRRPELEVYEVPRGAFGSHPPRPEDDMSTVSLSHRLVARSSLSDRTVSDFTRLLFGSRAALVSQNPLAQTIEALDPDEAAALEMHPGARKYFSGEQQTFIERYGDWAYIGLTLVTMVASGLGALFSFISARRQTVASRCMQDIHAVLEKVKAAHSTAELSGLRRDADGLLADVVARRTRGDIGDDPFLAFTILHQSVGLELRHREWQLHTVSLDPAAPNVSPPAV